MAAPDFIEISDSKRSFLVFFQWFVCVCLGIFLTFIHVFNPETWPSLAINSQLGFLSLMLGCCLLLMNFSPKSKTIYAALFFYLAFFAWVVLSWLRSPAYIDGQRWAGMYLQGGVVFAIGLIIVRPLLVSISEQAVIPPKKKAKKQQEQSAEQGLIASLPVPDLSGVAFVWKAIFTILGCTIALDALHQVFVRDNETYQYLLDQIAKSGRDFITDSVLFNVAAKRARSHFGNPNVFCAFLGFVMPFFFALLTESSRKLGGWFVALLCVLVVYASYLFGQFGLALIVCGFVVIGLIMSREFLPGIIDRIHRANFWLVAICIVLVWYAALLSGSRGGLLCLLFSTIASGCFFCRKDLKSKGLAVGAALAVAFLLFVFLRPNKLEQMDLPGMDSSVAEQVQIVEEVAERNSSGLVDRFLNNTTVKERLYYWRSARSMIALSPLTGNGLGSYGELYQTHKILEAHEVQDAHNIFLQLFCEMGLIGILLFGLWFGFCIFCGVRALLKCENEFQRAMIAALLISLFAWLLGCQYDISYSPIWRNFFIGVCLVLGLLVAFADFDAPIEFSFSLPWQKRVLVLVYVALLMVGSLGSWLLIFKPSKAREHVDNSNFYFEQGDRKQAFIELRFAQRMAPKNASILRRLSQLKIRSGDLVGAKGFIKQGLLLSPNSAALWASKGRLNGMLEEFEESEKSFKRAIECYPFNATYHQQLSTLYVELARWDDAVASQTEAARVANQEFKSFHLEKLADIFLKQDKKDRAIDALQDAIKQAEPKYRGQYRLRIEQIEKN